MSSNHAVSSNHANLLEQIKVLREEKSWTPKDWMKSLSNDDDDDTEDDAQ